MTNEPRLLIDGKLGEAEGGATFGNIDPATGETLGHVADGSKGDVARAVAAARRVADAGAWASDLEASMGGAVMCCLHAGQGCALPTRLLVPRQRCDDAVEIVRAGFESWNYGDLNGGIWYGPDAPFGGYKGSGIGRQCGTEGLEMFTETKTVAWPAGHDDLSQHSTSATTTTREAGR